MARWSPPTTASQRLSLSYALERTTPSGHLGAARTRGVLVALDAPAAPPFDVVEAKLEVPTGRTVDVSRTALTNRMRSERSAELPDGSHWRSWAVGLTGVA